MLRPNFLVKAMTSLVLARGRPYNENALIMSSSSSPRPIDPPQA